MTAAWWDGAVGRRHRLSRTFTIADLAAYETLVGDRVSDAEVPAPLVAGLISAILGVQLPGPGTNYLKQEVHPVSAVNAGEAIEAEVEVVRVVSAKRLVYLRTTCRGADGRLVLEGKALVLAGGMPAP